MRTIDFLRLLERRKAKYDIETDRAKKKRKAYERMLKEQAKKIRQRSRGR